MGSTLSKSILVKKRVKNSYIGEEKTLKNSICETFLGQGYKIKWLLTNPASATATATVYGGHGLERNNH